MSFFDEFLDCRVDKVSIAPFVSRDKYSAPTYGASVEYDARVVYKRTWMRKADNSQIVGKGIVWLGAVVKEEDQLTLPDGTTPPIMAAEEYHDETGFSHSKIIFG